MYEPLKNDKIARLAKNLREAIQDRAELTIEWLPELDEVFAALATLDEALDVSEVNLQ